MFPTTSYTRIDPKQVERNKHETNIIMRGKKRAIMLAKDRIAYLLEIGHADTARALKEKIDG